MKGARLYHPLGWRLIPLHSVGADGSCTCGHTERPDKSCECGNPKCQSKHGPKSIGKHPRLNDWPKHASSDPGQIERWQSEHPDANLGAATGTASGFWGLDVDPENGGLESLARLEREHGPLPETALSRTGGGGYHYLFKQSGHPVTNSAGKIAPGLDVRGDGGQIVIPPSISGRGAYTWIHAPWDVPLAPAPAWLLAMLGRAPTSSATAPTARGYFPPATAEVLQAAAAALAQHGPAVDGDGGGLHTVHAAAILTHDFALTDEEAWPLFVEWNATCVPPWVPDELRERLRRGRKYGKREYGCQRAMDLVECARKLIHDWRDRAPSIADDAERESSMDRMVREVRTIVARCEDPLHRERIQTELVNATGLKVSALALPRVKARAEPRDPTADQTTWERYGFDLSNSGVPLANIDNAVKVLEHERRVISLEQFTGRIRTSEGEWSDGDDLDLTLYMQRNLGLSKMMPQIVNQAVVIYARQHSRDVVIEWLERLAWDGEDRIAGFLTRAYGVREAEYTRAASANFWKSIAARAMRPGCKVDTMLILEGAQGAKKSTSLRAIAGDAFFAEASESPQSKDFFLALQGKLLIEVGEMDSFSRGDVTAVKRVLSCPVDRFRAPYERATRDWPRRGVFVGTTNKSDYLRDDTGGRRFWPVRCETVDLGYIRDHREQLFAEAVARAKRGESWWEMPDAETKAAQEARFHVDPWEEVLAPHLDQLPANAEVVVSDLLRSPLGLSVGQMDKATQMRAASVLRRLKWERVDRWDSEKKKVRKAWRKCG